VGVYRYFAAQLPGVVEMLTKATFGLEGDRAGGLNDLLLAANHGIYSREPARMMLLNIYGTYERPDSFSAILADARSVREKYTDNPLVHWRWGDVLRRAGFHAEAEAVFREVLLLIDSGKPGYDNRMYSRWSMVFRIGWMMREQGNNAGAVEVLSGLADEYESGREVWPDWVVPAAYLQLAEAYMGLDKPEKARENIDKVLKMRDMRGSHKTARALEGRI
jgi:tetratricopeptide (TPR) repeat protein